MFRPPLVGVFRWCTYIRFVHEKITIIALELGILFLQVSASCESRDGIRQRSAGIDRQSVSAVVRRYLRGVKVNGIGSGLSKTRSFCLKHLNTHAL